VSLPAFDPPFGLRSPHTQSLLNSSAIRQRLVAPRAAAMVAAEQEWLMDGGNGIRLMAHYSAQPGTRRGVAVLLHGWEGSSRSNYILATGARLYSEGWDVFRLNFRDHGPTHHLNPGIFHSCRLDEVINALGDMQSRLGVEGWCIAGFSLGGNFALRTALRGPGRGLSIGQAFAVCPVLDPEHTLRAMEEGPKFYHDYYVRKWGRSLRIKQAAFPERYAYDEWFELDGMRARTEYFATRYYDFPTVDAYFDGYSVAGERMAAMTVPCRLLTSEDDPVIPVSDFAALPKIPQLQVLVTPRGGHCGYLKNWKLESWAEDAIAERFGAVA